MRSAWLPGGIGTGRLRLFVFPNAGGAASMFRGWRERLGPAVDVCPVQLPGRESRLREPAHRSIDPLVAALEPALRPAMDRPFALAGHSMGTAIAFELAHRLRDAGGPPPAFLVLAGRQAPHLPALRAPVYDAPDEDLIDHLRAFGGTPTEVLDNGELMALLLPMLRADFELIETYRTDPERPRLDLPLLVYGGGDDPDTPPERLRAWGELTTASARVRTLPGGHFFLHQDRDRFLDLLQRDLGPWLP